MFGKAFFEILTSDGDVTTALGSRIYSQHAPQDVAMPYAIYRQAGGEGDHHADGASGFRNDIYQIAVFGSNHADIQAAVNALRVALDGVAGLYATNIDVRGVFLENNVDDAQSPFRAEELGEFGELVTFRAFWKPV
jgi:hypothetical protein